MTIIVGQFEELYQALQIPREDIHAAWSLVNVHGAPQIGKEQCIMFFHVLNSRRLGKRVPATLPGALRTSFLGDSNYAMSDNYAVNEIRQQAGRPSVPMSFATKSAFSSQKGHVMADDYLSRLNQKESAASGIETMRFQYSLAVVVVFVIPTHLILYIFVH